MNTVQLIRDLATNLKKGIVTSESIREVLFADNQMLHLVIGQWLNDGDVVALEKLSGTPEQSKVLWLEYNLGL